MLTPLGRVARFRWLLLYAILATSMGCYQYVPTTMDAVPTGDHVRALLSTEGQQDVAQRMGRLYTVLEGKVLEKNADQLLLSIPTAKVASQFGSESLYQRIDVSRQGIVRLDLRRLDKFRTYGLLGVATGVAAFIVVQSLGEGEPGSPSSGPPTPADHLLPDGLLRLTLFRW